jgi:hypothetical protein
MIYRHPQDSVARFGKGSESITRTCAFVRP